MYVLPTKSEKLSFAYQMGYNVTCCTIPHTDTAPTLSLLLLQYACMTTVGNLHLQLATLQNLGRHCDV